MYIFELIVSPIGLIKLILVDLKYLFKPQTYNAIALL